MITYKITASGLAIVNPSELVKVVFPNFEFETVNYEGGVVLVQFESRQTPVDLGPMIQVVEIPQE